MELTEHLLSLARRINAQVDEVHDGIRQVADIPMIGPMHAESVQRELLMHSSMSADQAWRTARKLEDHVNAIQGRWCDLKTEIELLRSASNDAIRIV